MCAQSSAESIQSESASLDASSDDVSENYRRRGNKRKVLLKLNS